jgi:hypothetical protein
MKTYTQHTAVYHNNILVIATSENLTQEILERHADDTLVFRTDFYVLDDNEMLSRLLAIINLQATIQFTSEVLKDECVECIITSKVKHYNFICEDILPK